ncbi:hypothetical protein [Thalassospira lucentensis]|uniref:hypothetical protein n=1 Tax=Thalassospira lucentensis TaxID=168935 RepID=UPI0003B55E1C|nr:hypothetical protein [Thalassospira lucentensis]RCK19703.1 hypothetical protein TH1_20755 [Thalassospira lucentensis MCCC 1A00383 = DSM 14000]
MPLIKLEPKKSVPLSECKDRDPMAETTISNKTDKTAKYVISYDSMPLSVQNTLNAHQSVTMCSPAGSILNDGDVELIVETPGL